MGCLHSDHLFIRKDTHFEILLKFLSNILGIIQAALIS